MAANTGAPEAFRKMAGSLRAILDDYFVEIDGSTAEEVLGDFLDQHAQVFSTYDQIHPSVARDPKNVAVLDDRIRREVALAAMPAVRVTDGGINVFGLNGFILGPVIAAMFIAVWDIFGAAKQSSGRPELG